MAPGGQNWKKTTHSDVIVPQWCISFTEILAPGPWFNIKMPSYQYRKSHCGDKTILRPSYLHNGISYTDKTIFYIESGPRASVSIVLTTHSWISQCLRGLKRISQWNLERFHKNFQKVIVQLLFHILTSSKQEISANWMQLTHRAVVVSCCASSGLRRCQQRTFVTETCCRWWECWTSAETSGWCSDQRRSTNNKIRNRVKIIRPHFKKSFSLFK